MTRSHWCGTTESWTSSRKATIYRSVQKARESRERVGLLGFARVARLIPGQNLFTLEKTSP